MNDSLAQAAQTLSAKDEELRKVLYDVYAITEDGNEGYNSVAISAVDCGIKLFNIITCMKGKGGVLRALMDLTVGLNGNPFWTKHGMVLIPILHITLQAQADNAILASEKVANPTTTQFDSLYTETRLVGIEIFCMIAFLLGGAELMALKSLEIKQKLSPFFMV